ncbi:hypothetical protein SCHPADRAFT_433221 [Schizopora paradoxa]|uniref:Uncharacterized protein n=1 Tax=Schizopora paradoxa TaxID=27342 RepID=A0A0H2RK30_9AGAM|nr:hypothetical protein SCHPADRAFT_433221 [Schizopora paradoxa]
MASPMTPPSTSSSPSSSLSSEDFELSFDYEVVDGQLVRVSKGSTKSPQSTPPTPPQEHLPATASCIPLIPQTRRLSLSRSESMPSEALAPPRPLQRAVSGPVSLTSLTTTPAASSKIASAPTSTGLQGTGRKLGGGALRIRKEDAERQRLENEERYRRDAEALQRERLRRLQEEEKENHAIGELRSSPPQNGRPIASLPLSKQLRLP